jgi:hypothetical protein
LLDKEECRRGGTGRRFEIFCSNITVNRTSVFSLNITIVMVSG